MINNGDTPAYPISEEETDRYIEGVRIFTGLTKRELFASMAMQGILANQNYDAPRRLKIGRMAHDAASAADALIIELEGSS